jgi:hypothetical protein
MFFKERATLPHFIKIKKVEDNRHVRTLAWNWLKNITNTPITIWNKTTLGSPGQPSNPHEAHMCRREQRLSGF